MDILHPLSEDLPAYRKKAEENFEKLVERLACLSPLHIKDVAHELGRKQIELEMQNVELRMAQGELAALHRKYEELYNTAPVGYFTFDAQGNIQEVNRTGAALLGANQGQLVRQPFMRFIAEPKDVELFYAYCREIIRTATPRSCEIKLTRAVGGAFYALLHCSAERLPEGQDECVRGIVIDLTQRKQAEKERDRLFDYSIDMLCVVDFSGGFKRVSPSFERILGWKTEELLDKPFRTFLHPEDEVATNNAVKEHADGKEAISYENRYRCRDGSYKWISWNAHPLLEEQLIIGVGRDVTEQKKLAGEREALIQELQEALSRVKTLTGLLPICSWCKKVRDDAGYWQQVESYLSEHSNVLFSHGICPECYEKANQELALQKKKKH